MRQNAVPVIAGRSTQAGGWIATGGAGSLIPRDMSDEPTLLATRSEGTQVYRLGLLAWTRDFVCEGPMYLGCAVAGPCSLRPQNAVSS